MSQSLNVYNKFNVNTFLYRERCVRPSLGWDVRRLHDCAWLRSYCNLKSMSPHWKLAGELDWDYESHNILKTIPKHIESDVSCRTLKLLFDSLKVRTCDPVGVSHHSVIKKFNCVKNKLKWIASRLQFNITRLKNLNTITNCLLYFSLMMLCANLVKN